VRELIIKMIKLNKNKNIPRKNKPFFVREGVLLFIGNLNRMTRNITIPIKQIKVPI
jgi:hypothetical protein